MELITLSWKAVELQVALPQTQELGKIQDELSKNNQRLQEALATSQLREERLKRKQVKESERSEKSAVRKDDAKELVQENASLNKKRKSEQQMRHPYLGSKFDFNG